MNESPNNPVPLPQRRTPASGVFVSQCGPTIVYLTVCTLNRVPWLAQESAHDTVRRVWAEAKAWSVGYYLLMPDHAHLFCSPHDINIPLDNWITYWKSMFRRATPDPCWRWQSNKWDTRLRNNENYHNKWEYVRHNPVRKGLASQPDNWPYQGILNELRW